MDKVQDPARLRREKAHEAVALATQGRWEEAVAMNRAILGLAPGDVEALNRLGKALSELGCYAEARDAFRQSVQLSPTNIIARKNLQRLAHLEDLTPAPLKKKAAPAVFIEERGRTCVTSLHNLAPKAVLARLAAGDTVHLRMDGSGVAVESAQHEPLGQVEPKLERRLIRLVNGGNRYVAAVTSVSERELVIILHETYCHPSMASVVSFPAKAEEYIPYAEVGEEELRELEQALVPEWTEPEGKDEGLAEVGDGAGEEAREAPVPSEEEEEEEEEQ